MNWMHVLE